MRCTDDEGALQKRVFEERKRRAREREMIQACFA